MCKLYALNGFKNTLESELSKERLHNAYGNNDKKKISISHLFQKNELRMAFGSSTMFSEMIGGYGLSSLAPDIKEKNKILTKKDFKL